MSIKDKKTWLMVLQIFMMIEGILLCCTIFGAVIGVPAILGATKFGELRKKSDEELKVLLAQSTYVGWGIFGILCCGVIGILCFVFIYTGNNDTTTNS